MRRGALSLFVLFLLDLSICTDTITCPSDVMAGKAAPIRWEMKQNNTLDRNTTQKDNKQTQPNRTSTWVHDHAHVTDWRLKIILHIRTQATGEDHRNKVKVLGSDRFALFYALSLFVPWKLPCLRLRLCLCPHGAFLVCRIPPWLLLLCRLPVSDLLSFVFSCFRVVRVGWASIKLPVLVPVRAFFLLFLFSFLPSFLLLSFFLWVFSFHPLLR